MYLQYDSLSQVQFDSIRTMTEARIVLEHLFKKNVEGTIKGMTNMMPHMTSTKYV